MKEIFVFGSNLAGRHGKGAALCALNEHGAVYGQGKGRQGNSYAIPTKNWQIRTISLDTIETYVEIFKEYVELHQHDSLRLVYNVTPIGCGLAGYKPEQIAPMFKWALKRKDIKLPKEFLEVLNEY